MARTIKVKIGNVERGESGNFRVCAELVYADEKGFLFSKTYYSTISEGAKSADLESDLIQKMQGDIDRFKAKESLITVGIEDKIAGQLKT